MYPELEARAKYKVGDVVRYRGGPHQVVARYYRRSEDSFYYDVKEQIGNAKGARAQTRRKVAEEDLIYNYLAR